MAQVDVWFSRHDNTLWWALARTGLEPHTKPRRAHGKASGVVDYLSQVHEVIQVGILPPEMIGLEDVEV